MYNWFKRTCEKLLRIPPAPEAPPGDEASTRVFRASPNYFKYLVFIWGVQTAIGLLPIIVVGCVFIAVSLSIKDQTVLITMVISLAILVVVLFALHRVFRLALLRLDYEKRWYVVTDRSLRVREGVISVQEMTITFANIQNISISQGPIQRLLGVVDLRVDTAGGGGASGHGSMTGHDPHTAWFRGVDNANEVRELIQHRLRRLKDSGLGDHEEVTHHPSAILDQEVYAALGQILEEARALRKTLDQGTTRSS